MSNAAEVLKTDKRKDQFLRDYAIAAIGQRLPHVALNEAQQLYNEFINTDMKTEQLDFMLAVCVGGAGKAMGVRSMRTEGDKLWKMLNPGK